MVNVSIDISEDEWNLITMLAQNEKKKPEDILSELIKEYLKEERVKIAIKLLKEDKIKFRNAWKLSGLSLTKFMEEVNKAGINV